MKKGLKIINDRGNNGWEFQGVEIVSKKQLLIWLNRFLYFVKQRSNQVQFCFGVVHLPFAFSEIAYGPAVRRRPQKHQETWRAVLGVRSSLRQGYKAIGVKE
jgi:hypothetical protein